MLINLDPELAHSRVRAVGTSTRQAREIALAARRHGRTPRPVTEETRPTLVEPIAERRGRSVLAARPKLATATARLS